MRLTLKAKLAATFAVVVAGGMYPAVQNLGALDESFDNAVNGNVKRLGLVQDDLDAEFTRRGAA